MTSERRMAVVAALVHRLAGARGEVLKARVLDLCEGYSDRELELLADFLRRSAAVAALGGEER